MAGNNSEKDLRTYLILMMMHMHMHGAGAWVSTWNEESAEDCIFCCFGVDRVRFGGCAWSAEL